jgi:hypothetical protein
MLISNYVTQRQYEPTDSLEVHPWLAQKKAQIADKPNDIFMWKSQLYPEVVMLACVVHIIKMIDPEGHFSYNYMGSSFSLVRCYYN